MEEEGKEDSDDVDTVVDSAGNFRRCPPNVYGEFTCDESSISASFVGIHVEEYYDEVSPFFPHSIDCFFLAICFFYLSNRRHRRFPNPTLTLTLTLTLILTITLTLSLTLTLTHLTLSFTFQSSTFTRKPYLTHAFSQRERDGNLVTLISTIT
jgi:hypothetical protein